MLPLFSSFCFLLSVCRGFFPPLHSHALKEIIQAISMQIILFLDSLNALC